MIKLCASVVWTVLLVCARLNFSFESRVTLQGNGYRDVVVAFPTDTPEEERQRLVSAAQDAFITSSVALYIATRRRSYFKDVSFLFPKSWKMQLPGNATLTSAGPELYEEADIVLTSDELKRSMPYTLHDGGCGEQSLRIFMPTEFLLSDMEQEEKDRRFVHEWAQYRYGVFAEGGFENDLRYPIYYSTPGKTDIRVTACTNTPLNYSSLNSELLPCTPEVDSITGRPTNGDCFFVPVVKEDTPLQSSVMYEQSLPHTFHFCDGDLSLERRHDPASPSKHNTLCGEEGTWFIILRNSDFRKGQNQATRYKPQSITFKYVQETSLRVVVAVEDSSYMKEKSRYDQVKRATAKFILYDLPQESEVGLISFSQQVSGTTSLHTLTSQSSRKRFLESDYIPSEPRDVDDRCPQCAILTALKLLQGDSANPKYGGLLILVTTTSLPEDSMHPLINNLTTSGVRLYVILMSTSRNPSVTLETVTAATSGKMFHIPESDSESDPSAIALSHLFMAFGAAVKGHSWKEEEEILVTQRILSSDTSDISFTFDVDSNLGRDMKVIITGPTFNERKSFLIDSFTTLHSGNDVYSVFERSEFLSAWIFPIQEAEAGNWTLKTRRKDGAKYPILILVSARQSENQTTITGRMWLNVADQQVDPKGEKPLKIYSEFRVGLHPIVGARVSASVYHPGGEIVSEFRLLDDGIGDPDVTKNDGIYSSYFSNFTQAGHYSIVVHAAGDNNQAQVLKVASGPCCGSFVPAQSVQPIGPFTRVIGYISFLVTSQPPDTDIIPPNRIVDLMVTDADPEERRFTLQWAAAGNDYNHGSASSYRLKLFRDRTELRRRFDDTGLLMDLQRDITQHSEPTEYGGLQQFSVRLPETLESGYYYFGVTAQDEAQNTSPVSNTAQIYIEGRPKNETTECENIDTGTNSGSKLNMNIGILVACWLTFLHLFSNR